MIRACLPLFRKKDRNRLRLSFLETISEEFSHTFEVVALLNYGLCVGQFTQFKFAI
jgi:hypothetical protein